MADMLVELYHLRQDEALLSRLQKQGVQIKRALAPDRQKVVDFILANFSQGWADECAAAFSNQPVSCYIAVKNHSVIGFSCYESTAKNFFGPIGVLESERGQGIGAALLLHSLLSMRDLGYAYAIIGWAAETAIPFYQSRVQAVLLKEYGHGVYQRLIDLD